MGCVDSRLPLKVSLNSAAEYTGKSQFQIYAAIVSNNVIEVENIIERGFIVNYKMGNFARRTALHIAAEKGSLPIIKLLIVKGADVNVSDPNGVTPILLAAKNQRKDCVLFLYNNGADLDMKTNNGAGFKEYMNTRDREFYIKNLRYHTDVF